MIRASILVTGIRELATLDEGPVPRRGDRMSDLGLIPEAALAVDGGRVVWTGPERQLRRQVRLRGGGRRVDLGDRCVVPGFVDAHTHLLFAGERHGEVTEKLRGAGYLDIARRGGGLFKTVRATRKASRSLLRGTALDRLGRMLCFGTTAAEVKSGYALDTAGELRLLELVPGLSRSTHQVLVPTFLGAHAVPPEWKHKPDGYVRLVIERMLPEVARRRLARFVDVFCEPGFFTARQTERILRAARRFGFGLKVHAEEFVWSGGARVAARLGARSVEHLLMAKSNDRRLLAAAGVTAVILPVTPFASLVSATGVGRRLVDDNVPVALGTDLSPNSWVESMGVVLSHAVYGARLTPAEAITAATVNSAHATDLSSSCGRLAPGLRADFLAFDVGSIEEIPYRIGSVPAIVSRQGNFVSSR